MTNKEIELRIHKFRIFLNFTRRSKIITLYYKYSNATIVIIRKTIYIYKNIPTGSHFFTVKLFKKRESKYFSTYHMYVKLFKICSFCQY